MKPTITDIARDTGLSLATISKYLNNKPILSENRKRIEASIQRLGYTPNRIAQSLRSKKTSTIAIVIPPLCDGLWGNTIHPLDCTLRQHGYSSIVCTSTSEPEKAGPLSAFLIHNQIDGVIAIDDALDDASFSLFSRNQIPYVCIDYVPNGLPTDLVSSDNYSSAYQAGSYFVKHHHTRIGFLAGRKESYTTIQRTRGFLAALLDGGIPSRPEYCSYGDSSSSASAQRRFKELMALPEPPTALFFSNYAAFLGGFTEIMNQGIRIPEDLSIISFENDKIFDTLSPKITVIQQDFDTIAQKAASLLLKRLSNQKEHFPETVLVDTIFINGNSVKYY